MSRAFKDSSAIGASFDASNGSHASSPDAQTLQAAGLNQALREAGDEAQDWDYYAGLVRAAGGVVPSAENKKVTVLGLRTGTESKPKYTDQFVVLRADKTFELFVGTTVPSGPAVHGRRNGDGTPIDRKGLGILAVGNYVTVARQGEFMEEPAFRVQAAGGKNPRAYRDENGDGVWSDEEIANPKEMFGELFHVGFKDSTASEGCMTMPPVEYTRFLSAVGGAGASFNFTLINK